MEDFGRINVAWFATIAERDAFIPSPVAGQLVGVADDLYKHNGTAWSKVASDLFDLARTNNPYSVASMETGMTFEWDAGGFFRPRGLRGVFMRMSGALSLPSGAITRIPWNFFEWNSGDGVLVSTPDTSFTLNAIGLWSVSTYIPINFPAAVATTSYFQILLYSPDAATLTRVQKVQPGVGGPGSNGDYELTFSAHLRVTDPTQICEIGVQTNPAADITSGRNPSAQVIYLGYPGF